MEGAEPKMPGAPGGIQIMTPQQFVAKAGDMPGEEEVEEGVRDLGYDAQSLIMKLRRDVEEKRLQPTPQAVLAAARELAGDMEFAPQLLVKQVLGQGVTEGDAYMESLQDMLERSVSQAQHNLMVGVAHNPQFAQKVKVKQQVGQEFAKADTGRDISKLPMRVTKKK